MGKNDYCFNSFKIYSLEFVELQILKLGLIIDNALSQVPSRTLE